MTELTLTAIFEEVEEGGFIGYVAELPGANTQGETLDEVRENLSGAIELILNFNREEFEKDFFDQRESYSGDHDLARCLVAHLTVQLTGFDRDLNFFFCSFNTISPASILQFLFKVAQAADGCNFF